MTEAKKIEQVLRENSEKEDRLNGREINPDIIKEAIRSAEVFFQIMNEDVKRSKEKPS